MATGDDVSDDPRPTSAFRRSEAPLALPFYATSHHSPAVRLLMGAAAAGLGTIIVVLENTL